MLEKIDHIKVALKVGAYEAALALALTLPDICAKVENGKSTTSGNDYIAWVDKYVNFKVLSFCSDTQQAEMDGTLVYALRCAFLHCGNDQIKDQNAGQNLPHTSFKVMPPNSLGKDILYHYHIRSISEEERIIETQIDAGAICRLLYETAENYYNEYQQKNDFDPYTI